MQPLRIPEREIKTFDQQDYDPTWPVHKRDSARAIIFVDGQLVLVKSKKYGEYKFPGGGIKPGESHENTLIRETMEEAGMAIIPSTIKPYGKTTMRRKSSQHPQEIFEQESFYYTCKIDPQKTTHPTPEVGYETEYGYAPVLATLVDAIAANRQRLNIPAIPWAIRDLAVMEELQVTSTRKD